MTNESVEQKQPQRIFKGKFGLSEQDVLQAIEEARESSKDTMLVALSTASPSEVLAEVRKLYDKGVELESSGIPAKEIVAQLRGEFPNIQDVYWLLRKQPWGYQLGQQIFAAKMLEEEEALYGSQSSKPE